MKRFATRSLVWVTAILLVPMLIQAQKKITWYQMDIMPAYINNGPHKGKGFQDGLDLHIKKTLEAKGYEVTMETANMARIIGDFESGKNVGTGGMFINPELEKIMNFSVPHSIVLPVAAIVLKNKESKFKPFMDDKGYFNLDEAITKNQVKIGLASGRPYTGIIDEILLKNKDNKNIYYRTGTDISEGLFSMLTEGRFDYTLLFPWEAKFIKETLNKKEEFIAIPVQGMPNYVFAYVTTPKNDFGKEVMAVINPELEKMRNTAEFHKVKEYWLDENSKAFYRKYAKEFYGY